MDGADQNTGKHELFRAIIELIVTANPDRREALGTTIEAYARDFPEDFHWGVGASAPALLHHLLSAIEAGCRPPVCRSRRCSLSTACPQQMCGGNAICNKVSDALCARPRPGRCAASTACRSFW